MDDRFIRQAIIDELNFEPSVEAEHIGVTVDNGIVTLSGHVSTYAEKIAAEKAAFRVAGVKAVVETIGLPAATNSNSSDQQLANRVVNILAWHSQLPKSIKAKVQNGRVTLSGNVEWHYQLIAALSAVQRLAGVVGVTNDIRIVPHPSAADVRQTITKALHRSTQIQADSIKIQVKDGNVTLEGAVHTLPERAAIERAAWSAPGVKAVQDLMKVV